MRPDPSGRAVVTLPPLRADTIVTAAYGSAPWPSQVTVQVEPRAVLRTRLTGATAHRDGVAFYPHGRPARMQVRVVPAERKCVVPQLQARRHGRWVPVSPGAARCIRAGGAQSGTWTLPRRGLGGSLLRARVTGYSVENGDPRPSPWLRLRVE